MPLSFHKMHANGDDFVFVDSRNLPNPITSNVARRMGDRNRGVGFNKLAVVLVHASTAAVGLYQSKDRARMQALIDFIVERGILQAGKGHPDL